MFEAKPPTVTRGLCSFVCFFFNDTATTEIYTLSLHDALPICRRRSSRSCCARCSASAACLWQIGRHTSELQSPDHLVCRLLLEKKKKTWIGATTRPHPPTPNSSRPRPPSHALIV